MKDHHNNRRYFNMEVYSTKDGFKSSGFDKLSKDIQRSSFLSFQCHRYDYCTWYVTRYQEAYDKVKSIIPRVKHVRTVTLYEDRLNFNFPHGTLYGLPCIYELKVASTIPG